MSLPPETRSFSAVINLQPPGPSQLIVTGDVETPSSADLPHLSPNDAPRNPASTLELDLTIRNSGGIGTPAFEFHPVRFEAPAVAAQYKHVVILWCGSVLLRLDVDEVH